jgi:hypothetical protein
VIRDLKRLARRISRLYDYFLDDNEEVYKVRRIMNRKRKKRKWKLQTSTFKYGVQVPTSVEMARKLDIDNGNTAWEGALKSEMRDLFNLECFDIKSIGYAPGDDYQKTTLRIIYNVKQDLRRKAGLVAGEHLVDPLDHSVYSSTVKGISVKLLHVIAHKADMSQLYGNVSLAFVNASTNELVYSIAGPQFGEHEGKTVIICKALYGLCTSAKRWHSHFANTLWSLEFKPTRFNNNVVPFKCRQRRT